VKVTGKLWGGRFSSDITSEVLAYTLTTDVDVRLVEFDVWQDIVHVLMLGKQQIIPAEVVGPIVAALLDLLDADEVVLRPELEDVHFNVEQLVIEATGLAVGGHMHTGRSRNDQVATDLRMYLRAEVFELVDAALALIDVLLDFPESDYLAILPGYTHSQPAQPVSVAFWRTAHASMLLRDVGRLRDVFARLDECPLGAGALAGTSFDLDRAFTADLLGFDRVMAHALDATSARDHVVEFASALAIGATTLSRMAEEIVVWSGHEYRLCEIGDEYATGSSIMPQKKNPVVAELVRGRAGRCAGTLVQLLTMVKSVTLGYSCDLQEDKPYLWQSIDTYLSTLRVVTGQTRGLRFDTARGEQLCWNNFTTATELANHLVAEHEVPFRESHRIVGEIVGALIAEDRTLRDTDRVSALLAERGHAVAPEVLLVLLDPRTAVTGYTSAGGTAPTSVTAVRHTLAGAVAEHRSWLADRRARVDTARARSVALARASAAAIPVPTTGRT
jgi:argininosuccinate lyase